MRDEIRYQDRAQLLEWRRFADEVEKKEIEKLIEEADRAIKDKNELDAILALAAELEEPDKLANSLNYKINSNPILGDGGDGPYWTLRIDNGSRRLVWKFTLYRKCMRGEVFFPSLDNHVMLPNVFTLSGDMDSQIDTISVFDYIITQVKKRIRAYEEYEKAILKVV